MRIRSLSQLRRTPMKPAGGWMAHLRPGAGRADREAGSQEAQPEGPAPDRQRRNPRSALRGVGCVGMTAAALSICLGVAAALRWINSPVRPGRDGGRARGAAHQPGPQPTARATARPGAGVPSPGSGQGSPGTATAGVASAAALQGVDPNLPLYVGDSRRIAARAIDDTAASPLDQALLGLGRRFLGTASARQQASAPGSEERLVLDLTSVDDLSYVEQLLALVNSRRVRTRTEAVDRFSDHVRRLRYGGRVEPCRRLRQPSLWALAAEQRGYLVDLSRFLPGAQRTSVAHEPRQQAAPGRTGVAPSAGCSLPGGAAGGVPVASVPLAALEQALPSLRSGDLFVLVGGPDDRDRARIGLVDRDRGRTGALLVSPGVGVVRSPDLIHTIRQRPGTIGVSFLRPVPNAEGRPER